jgi:feruloyl esterase
MSFMTPPNPTDMSKLRDHGAKLLVYQGTSDPVFSINDTITLFQGLTAANHGDATSFARLFPVPGMNHCGNGPAADQFDIITPLVNWVENGIAPASITSAARGAGTNSNAALINAEVPAEWAPGRTRPLCPWPLVARYNGTGDIESAASFSCKS